VLTLDTSALYALVFQKDIHHPSMTAAREADSGPYFVPAGILAEVGYMLQARSRHGVIEAFLEDLASGAYTLDCGERDLLRIRDLLVRYEDLNLGLADASVIACAERHTGKVLTSDRRHFDVVARGEEGIVVLP
jgi:uncharacterized protein